MSEKHRKKLTHLQQQRTGESQGTLATQRTRMNRRKLAKQ